MTAGTPKPNAIDWGEHWIPDTLPTERSTRNLAAWFAVNVDGLMAHIQDELAVAVGGGDDAPFRVVAFDANGSLGVSRPLIAEIADNFDCFRSGDGSIHESHHAGLRKHTSELIAYLQGFLAEIDAIGMEARSDETT